MATIKKKPDTKVYSLTAPARVANTWGWRSTYKTSDASRSTKSNSRATHVVEEWELDLGLNYKDKNGKWVLKNPRRSVKAGIAKERTTTCWINADYDWSNGFKNVTRNSFYPLTKRILYNIHIRVRLWNEKGYGPEVHVYKALQPPRAPSISVPTHDAQTGRVSCTVKVNYGREDDYEAYDCYWQIKVVDTRNDDKERVVNSGTNRGEEFTLAYDVADRMQLTYGQYVRVTFEAWTRGLRGNSKHSSRQKFVSYPAKAEITGVDIPSLADTAKVTVRCKTNSWSAHPVTEVKLQAIRSVPYSKASDIPSTESWDDTGAVDNGTCAALSQSILDFRPVRGTHTWVRIKTIYDHESLFYRYSDPVELSELYVPPASAGDDDIVIVSTDPGEDGESIAVTMGWNADGEDDANGTELTWSDFEEAWRSTEPPQLHEFEWSDGELIDGGVTYHDSARVLIRGLTNGTRYFIRARRFMNGETKTYSSYSDTVPVLTGSDPGTVVLLAPQFVEKGRSLSLSWSLGDGPEQTSWEILTGETVAAEEVTEVDPATGQSVTTEKGLAWKDGTEQQVVATGEGATCSCSISAERLASLTTESDEIPLSVRSARGGEYVESVISVVKIADAPTLVLTVPEEVTAQGPSISLTSSVPAELRLTCIANGATGDSPDGMREQATGDVVWSDALTPEWSGTDTFTASVILPTGLDFWDGASYTIRAIAKDATTGLECEPVEATFSVVWARQAPAPSDDISVVASDVTDEDGVRTRSVTLTLVAPDGAAVGDVYDVYRVTSDGVYAIAVDQSLNAVVVDPYAPYGDGDKSYRVAIRTTDGDFDWLDFQYELEGSDLRIDFGNRYVELPWNVVISDKWEKDFEARSHMGVEAPEGYWNENVKRSASLSTDTIKVGDEEKRTLLRDLAQYAGPCFVRTVTGSAFEANVTVGGLEYRYASEVCAVTLDAAEVGLTKEYMATVTIPEDNSEPIPTPDESVPDEEEP